MHAPGFRCLVLLALAGAVANGSPIEPAALAPAATASPMAVAHVPAGFAVESYYRVKWGFEEEFVELFRKNHLPFLERQLEKGLLLEIRLDSPQEHMPEEARWDFRVTLVYRDAGAAYSSEKITEDDYQAIIQSDEQEAVFTREEHRRFELLEAHWDINVKSGEVFEVN